MVIKEKTINNKLAQLILDEDNITVKVIYNGVCIDSSSGNTWNNIKDEDWLQESMIDFAVTCLGDKKDKDFDKMLEELD